MLGSFQANLMQKNQKKLMMGSMRTLVTDRWTDRAKKPFWTNLGQFWAKTFFFQKSKNVTFLDLLKANLMQKIRKI